MTAEEAELVGSAISRAIEAGSDRVALALMQSFTGRDSTNLDDRLAGIRFALSRIASGDEHGPDGLEGIALALARGHEPTVSAGLFAIADALAELADAVRGSKRRDSDVRDLERWNERPSDAGS